MAHQRKAPERRPVLAVLEGACQTQKQPAFGEQVSPGVNGWIFCTPKLRRVTSYQGESKQFAVASHPGQKMGLSGKCTVSEPARASMQPDAHYDRCTLLYSFGSTTHSDSGIRQQARTVVQSISEWAVIGHGHACSAAAVKFRNGLSWLLVTGVTEMKPLTIPWGPAQAIRCLRRTDVDCSCKPGTIVNLRQL